MFRKLESSFSSDMAISRRYIAIAVDATGEKSSSFVISSFSATITSINSRFSCGITYNFGETYVGYPFPADVPAVQVSARNVI